MAIFDYYDEQIPDYYHGMHRDGYTPEQILYAKRRQLREAYNERVSTPEKTELEIEVKMR